MFRSIACGLIAAALIAVAGMAPVQAQNDEKSQLVAKLVGMMNMDEIMTQSTVAMRDQIVMAIRQQDPNVDPKVIEIVVGVAEEESMLLIQEVMPPLMQKMGSYYTVSELREMIAFYETPLGQKAIALMPTIAADTQEIMVAVLPAFQQRMMVKLQDRLKAAGFQ